MWLLNWWMMGLSWDFSLYFQNHTFISMCSCDTGPESRATWMYSEVLETVIYVPSILWNRRHYSFCLLWSQWYLLCPCQKNYVSISRFSWFWQILSAISQLWTNDSDCSILLILTWAQQIGFVKSKEGGKAKPVLQSQWQSLTYICGAMDKCKEKRQTDLEEKGFNPFGVERLAWVEWVIIFCKNSMEWSLHLSKQF